MTLADQIKAEGLCAELPEGGYLMQDIVDRAAEVTGIPAEALKGRGARAHFAEPRHLAIRAVRDLTYASYTEIGEAFDGRDHTTILASCNKAAELVRKNPMRCAQFMAIWETFAGRPYGYKFTHRDPASARTGGAVVKLRQSA